MELFFNLILAMFMWHAIADFPLQGDFMAKAKNPTTAIPGISSYMVLYMHCLIHAAGVWLITGIQFLAAVEIITHAAIDTLKNRKLIDFELDQILHLTCKVIYAAIVVCVLKLTGGDYSFLSHFK